MYSQTANGNAKDPPTNYAVQQLSISFMHAVLNHWYPQNILIASYPVCRQQNCCFFNLAMRKATRRLGKAPIDLGQTLGQKHIQRNGWTEKHSDKYSDRQTLGHTNIQRKSWTEKISDKYSDRQTFGHANIQRNSRTEKISDSQNHSPTQFNVAC